MNIYLDIDGVLITKHGIPSNHVQEFLEYVIKNHSPYWLTTHCKGDAAYAVSHLKRYLPVGAHKYIEAIQATDWDVLKSDGIDFSQDFRWLDDAPMMSEESVLKKKHVLDKLIRINLENNPDQLRTLIDSNLSF